MVEPHRARLDGLLRPVLPVGDGAPLTARQCLREALGWKKVSKAADLPSVSAMVDEVDRTSAPALRPMAVGSQLALTE